MRTSHRSAPTLAAALLLLAGACASTRPPPAEALAQQQRSAAETAQRYDDPRTAASLYGRASRTAGAGDRPALAADASCREGLARLAAGEPRLALAPLERAVAQARALGDPSLAARALLGLARARQATGQGEVAEPLRQARALAEGVDPVAAALAEVGLGVLAPPAEAAAHFEAAERLGGAAPEVAGPLALNRARRAERDGQVETARAAYQAALAPLAETDDRLALLAALQGAARLADARPGAGAEAVQLHRRAAAVADGLGRAEAFRAETAAAERAAAAREDAALTSTPTRPPDRPRR